MYNLNVKPIRWEPLPIQDRQGWWFYGAMGKSTLMVEGEEYGLLLRIWSHDSYLYETDVPLETFKFNHELTFPDQTVRVEPTEEGTLEEMLSLAHTTYKEWARRHHHRLFQLSAFCSMLNKLYAINHLDSEEEEE